MFSICMITLQLKGSYLRPLDVLVFIVALHPMGPCLTWKTVCIILTHAQTKLSTIIFNSLMVIPTQPPTLSPPPPAKFFVEGEVV